MSGDKGRPVPILLMVRELGSGGIERDITKLAIGLDRRRFTPFVATYQAGGLRHDDLTKSNIPIVHLPVSSLKSPKTIVTAVQFWRFLKRNRIRLVHAFDSSGIFGIPLARFLGVPVILTSTVGHRGLLDQRTRRQFKLTDYLVDAIVVNCDAMRSHLTHDFSVPVERIELCYNGVDTREFYPLQESKPDPISDASLVIGTICVLRPEKALDVLQDAFARIRHLDPRMKLLIVGNGPELARLQQNSRRLGIEESSNFVSATPQVARFLRAIDVFVSSSFSEAFSNSILEAMACGCCVVASRVGGTPELIKDEGRGLLFASRNADEIAQKLVRVLQDVALRERLGARAAEFAANKLNMERNLRRMMEIYETLLCRKNALA